MIEESARRLPRGRSALARDEVERIHRERLGRAMAEAMAANGYAGTSVKDVLDIAGVSRRDFYRLYRSKHECFLDAFEGGRAILIGRILEGVGAEAIDRLDGGDDPVARFETGISAYLAALAGELPVARLFLVESYAAGQDAVRLRVDAQDLIAGALAQLMGVSGAPGRQLCAMIVAAVSARVTGLVALAGGKGDPVGEDAGREIRDRIAALGPEMTALVRRLWALGAFEEPPGR